MIAMKFTIELDIGLSFLLRAAPQLVTDRETKTHRRGRSKRSYGHCRRRTEIPEAEPSPAARPRDGPHCRRAEVKLPQDPPATSTKSALTYTSSSFTAQPVCLKAGAKLSDFSPR
jgi:hypothetical protein